MKKKYIATFLILILLLTNSSFSFANSDYNFQVISQKHMNSEINDGIYLVEKILI